MLGLLLALLCAFFSLGNVLGRRAHNLMLAGLAAGFALLSKQEYGAACYILLGCAILMEAGQERSPRALLYGIALCAPGSLLSLGIYGCFFWKLTPGFIFENWFGPNRYFIQTQGAHLYALAGFRFVPLELAVLVLSDALVLVLWFRIAKGSCKHIGRWPFAGAVVLLTCGLVAMRQFAPLTTYVVVTSFIFPRGMFCIGCAFLAYTLYKLRGGSGDRRLQAKAAFTVFALVLAIRVLAQVMAYGYSIFYNIPLFLVFVLVINESMRAAAVTASTTQRRKLVHSLLALAVLMLAIALIPRREPPHGKVADELGCNLPAAC